MLFKNNSKQLLIAILILVFYLLSVSLDTVDAGSIRYAKSTTTGNGDCLSWENACTLQVALNGATTGDEIWVMVGLYVPTMNTSDRNASFQLVSGVAVYGGFAGTETMRLERNPNTNGTVLSGDIDNNDTQTPFITDLATVSGNTTNSYNVVEGANGATLDGFTITAGYAGDGAGMANVSGSNAVLSNLTFTGNMAEWYGGGMYIDGSSPILTNVTFNGNASRQGPGGGMTLTGSSTPTLTNVTFSGNSTPNSDGGGMYIYASHPILTNVTFTGNSAKRGGGLYKFLDANPQFKNTIFWGNTASNNGPNFENYGGGTSNIVDSVVEGGCPSGSTCTNLITTDPLLGTLGDYGGTTKTIPLLVGSSALDTGNDATCAETDQRGVTRPQGSHCDIGAYEAEPFPIISGTTGLEGVTLSYFDGTDKTATSIAGGTYSLTVSNNWSGSVTPSLTGYTFTPDHLDYTDVLADQTDQNYTASAIPVTHSISGDADLEGVTLSYFDGTDKTATSIADGTYSFTVSDDWSGTVTPSLTGYTFTPDHFDYTSVLSDQTGQNFTASSVVTYTLSVNSEHGTVTKVPDITAYLEGDVVELTVTPSSGWNFTEWTGDATGTTNPVSVSMNANKTVTANFSAITHNLTVAVFPSASGTTDPDVGVHPYTENAVIDITATPETGYVFDYWSGACSGSGTCQVTMDDAKSVTANFILRTYTLNVSKTGTGSGSVTSSPAGINCGSTCFALFDYNTSVTLTAAADTGSSFTGWSGSGCSGTSTCTVLMEDAKSVVANFGLLPGAFNKTSPVNDAFNQPLSLTLSWGTSSDATNYEYCFDTTNNNICDGSWVNNGLNLSVEISGLEAWKNYYWQVRAKNSAGANFANSETWWSFAVVINDPLFSQQWGLARIDIDEAWAETQGSPEVIIAMLDSGIDQTHPDLADQLWVNPGEIAGNGLDDDNNGFVDDIHGWNFVSDDNDIADDFGHGTLISGVTAAAKDNGVGIVGVCPLCKLMVVKVVSASGSANYSDMAEGVLYAAEKGARVINISNGGTSNSPILRNAIATAVSTYDVVVVAGAGNNSLNQLYYPASYDNVLAVTGTDQGDIKTNVSNYGTWVDVSAPAQDTRTTAMGGGWVIVSGTSISSASTSGLAGLLRSLHPDWTQAMVRSQIIHTSEDIDGLNQSYTGLIGSGRIDAGSSMQEPHPLLTFSGNSINGETNGRPMINANSNLSVTLLNDWFDAPGVSGTLTTTDPYITITSGTSTFGTILAGASSTNATPFSISIANAGYNHPIPFTLQVTDTNGYMTSFDFTVMTESDVVEKHGTIISDETWFNNKSYLITANVNIPPTITLTIQPGTTILFAGSFALNVRGTLIANGTSTRPIQIKGKSGITWDKILFDDSSIDAQVDINGNYASGSILRYVTIQGITNGITVSAATPFISHCNLDDGGINGSLGTTTLWLQDNTINGNSNIVGSVNANNNSFSGSLSISGAGKVEGNSLTNTLSLGSGTAIGNTISNGGLMIGSTDGALENNIIVGDTSTGSIFNVVKNTITGALIVGDNSTVNYNTVSDGISVGSDVTATWNNVEDADGVGLNAGTNVTAQYNRLVGNAKGMIASTGLIEHNLIANNDDIGLQIGAATVRYNTLVGNLGNTIVVQGGNPIALEQNNFDKNTGTYDLYIDLARGSNVIAQNNWWGTTDENIIAERVYDYYDDDLKSIATYSLFMNVPSSTAPAFVRSVTVTPDSTLGIQTGTFEVEFSRSMDENQLLNMDFYNSYEVVQLSVGPSHACFVKSDGSVLCWGDNTYGQNNVPSGTYTKVSAGDQNTCGFKKDGTLICWGYGNSGMSTVPGGNYSQASQSTYHSCAVRSDGNIICWGYLGYYIQSPKTVVGNFTQVSTSTDNSGQDCGLRSDGKIQCWRQNSTSYEITSGDFIEVSSGGNHVCGLKTNGSIFCWGDNRYGQTTVPSGTYSQITSGYSHTCAIKNDGKVVCWGDNRYGQTNVPSGTYSQISGKSAHSCGIKTEGDLVCWGDNWVGSWATPKLTYPHYKIIDNSQWSSPTLYKSTFDLNSQIPKANYRIIIANAMGLDGLTIAPDKKSIFTVDYLNTITDQTAPIKPVVIALKNGSLNSITANWSSSDPDSQITMYRYAIGTTPGARDVVNWINTSNTSVTHTGLLLTQGQKYYVLVQARNEAGLWSESGISNSMEAGVLPTCYELTLSHFGEGNDPIASPAYSNGCTQGKYSSEEHITLSSGAPATGWSIAGWTGTSNNSSTMATNSLIMPDSNTSVSIIYTINTYALVVSKTGTGSGSVTSSPIGISCGSNCSNVYNYNTSVTLAAEAATNSTFSGWSGACSGVGSCIVNINAAKSVTANFTLSVPGAFAKTAPINGITNQSSSVTLKWAAGTGATAYYYCYDTTNDNSCSTWVSNGTATSVTRTGLSPNTTYYWQVRAVNANGTTYANASSSAYWSFKTGVPGAFVKTTPINGITNQPSSVNLKWGVSTGATAYYYCYDTTNDNTCSTWVTNGTATSVTRTGLSPNTTYYWQVRAVNANGTTYANASATTFWSFKTGTLPVAFNKITPTNLAINQPSSVTLKWAASTGAMAYYYCYDTTNDNTCSTWVSNGTATSVTRTGLSPNTTYYWQVRVVNANGTTYANASSAAYWSFKTGALPVAFNKTAPTNGAINQPSSVTLKWGVSTGATTYYYCYDTTNDNACSTWVSNGTSTSKALTGLIANTTYYWQVRVVNANGTTYANASATTFWSFKTGTLPAAFNKITPTNGAINQPSSVTLKWGASTGTTAYYYCFDTTNDNTCSTWVSNGTSTSKALTGLIANTTYYWQVRAVNANGITNANASSTSYWSFKR